VETDAFIAGQDARRRGKLRSANQHYPLAEPFRDEWFRGWDAEDAYIAAHGGHLGERLKRKLAQRGDAA
jgi:hypothetical protein